MFCSLYRPTPGQTTTPTRVAVDKDLMIVGGPDGAVSLYRTSRWFAHATPLWTSKIHDGPVTSVALCTSAGYGFSAGRDGHVYRHDMTLTIANSSSFTKGNTSGTTQAHTDGDEGIVADISAAQVSASQIVCRVSGEINVIALDDEKTKLFVAGDSLRYITLGEHPSVVSVPLPIPGPVVAVALAPCGKLIAAASGSTCDVCIVGLTPPPLSEATQSPDALLSATSIETAYPFASLKFVLRSVAPASWKQNEALSCGFGWCRSEPGLDSYYIIGIPTKDGVRLMRLLPKGHPVNPRKDTEHTLESVHTISVAGLRDTTSAILLTHTKTDFTLVVNGNDVLAAGADDEESGSSATNAAAAKNAAAATVPSVVVVKVSLNKKGKVSGTQRIGEYRTPSATSDVAVDRVSSGSLAVGSTCGSVSVIKSAVPLARKPKAPSNNMSTTEEGEAPQKKRGVADIAAPRTKSGGVVDVEDDDEDEEPQRQDTVVTQDKYRNLGEDEEATSKKNKKPRRGDSDEDEDDDANGEEDYRSVMKDLVRSKHHVLKEGTKRSSTLRSSATSSAAISKPPSQSTRAAYLDDEAEEGEEDSDADNAGDRDSDDEYDEEGEHDGSVQGDAGDLIDDHNSRADSAEGIGRIENPDDLLAGLRAGQQRQRNNNSSATVVDRDYHFQPGATPLKAVDGVSTSSCYLAYNSIGCIRYDSGGTVIQFHDVSRASIKLQERGRVEMAALGHSGAAVVYDVAGTEAAAEQEATSGASAPLLLYFRTYSALGAQSDWSLSLLASETCRCIAVGLRFVAVATSIGLRIFSLSGLEIAVLSIASRIVTMVGCNSTRLAQTLRHDQDPLAVAYLTGGGGSGLEVVVYNCHNGSVQTPPTPCPVTLDREFGDHYLQWLGFSDDGPLHTCDSAGVVRMHVSDWGGSWVPVHDPRHFTSDAVYQYWPWAMNDQHMFAYRSTGREDPFPVASATPPPMEQLRLCLPLLKNSGGEKRMIVRDRFIRNSMKMNELKRNSKYYTETIAKLDIAHDARLMELFKTALKEQQTSRAVDIATMFELRDSVEEAAREANKEGHKSVVLKLVQVIKMRHDLKLKRNCTLPLESQEVSDKERDQILRKLLQKEKLQQQDPTSAGGAGRPQGGAGNVPPQRIVGNVQLHKSVRLDEETLHTIEETAADAAVAAAPPQRRSVVFDESRPPAPTVVVAPHVANTKAPALVLAASTIHKSAPAAVAPATTVVELPAKKAEPPRFGKAASPSSAATTTLAAVATAPVVNNIIGAPLSAPASSPAAVTKPQPPGRVLASASPSGAKATAQAENIESATLTADTVVVTTPIPSSPPLKSNITPATAAKPAPPQGSPARAKTPSTTKSTTPGSAVKQQSSSHTANLPPAAPPAVNVFDAPAPAFVDVSSLPSMHSSSFGSASSHSSVSSLPRDPFLNPGEDGTRVGFGMRDVGHMQDNASQEASSQIMPKTLSFGEALRKRLREEDEADDDNDEGAPPRAMQSLFK
ncbi:Hypothetical protein, putative [Bodo saltans]|uniref:Uncharacterized protein n=1 Tax=Bodo saltans TaxID=75058 RepID=A0A0S4JAG0_BODSA|nr:Hypothetical protein, putative [Bodo saltans]|eukprot:CUG86920.1 Hypothetical protein, putative [Bodo saltans]